MAFSVNSSDDERWLYATQGSYSRMTSVLEEARRPVEALGHRESTAEESLADSA
jgi:hypothetical protein